MAEAIQGCLVLVLWGSFIRQMALLKGRPRTAEQVGGCAAIGLFSLTMTLLFPPVYLLVDRLLGIPNVSRLLANSLGMASGWAVSPVRVRALERQSRPGILGSGWLLLLAITIEATLFFVARTGESVPGNFAARYASLDAILAYRVILMVYVGTVMAQLFWVGWRHREMNNAIPQRYERLPRQLQTVGWGCGAAYALHEAAFPLLERVDLALPVGVHTAIQYLLLSGFVLLLLGSGFVSTGHWVVLYRRFRGLYPLWRDLRRLVPSIVSEPAAPQADSWAHDARIVSELEDRILGRVAEIQDGLLALRHYATSPVVVRALQLGQQARIGQESLDALFDAAVVAAALHAPGTARPGEIGPFTGPRGSADPDSEVRHLLRVSRMYRRSPFIRRSLTEARRAALPGSAAEPAQ
jgi:hypothetical protein